MEINAEWIDRWVMAINENKACQSNGLMFNDSFTIEVAENRYTFHVHKGTIEQVILNAGTLEASVFTLSAEMLVWQKLFSHNPPPMHQAIFSAIGAGHMKFEGNIRPVFQQMTTLSYWVQAARELDSPVEIPSNYDWQDEWQAVGRYTNVTIDGCRHKVFYFEAGEGIPILCQHTAGNENREWRHLLEDKELTKKYKIIAYDLPSHGKSDPPYDKDFFAEDHLLTSDWVTRFIVELQKSLKIEKPIFLGCSIGGVIALHLAELFPEKFRAVIALAGAVPTSGFFHDWWIDPAVNSNLIQAGLIDAVGPTEVSKSDRQINRICQGAHPKSMRNDLYLWGADNCDVDRPKRIDPTKVPIFMYSGQYDFTCPPELVEESARAIGPEVHYEMLENLGHFPMCENYPRFRPTLLKTLDKIESME
jgi:pimeloyl-ACP methyl ester carboxylesterase